MVLHGGACLCGASIFVRDTVCAPPSTRMDWATPPVPLALCRPGAGSLLCFHDKVRSTVEGIPRLVQLLRASIPQTTVNPQGRRVLSMDECLDPANE